MGIIAILCVVNVTLVMTSVLGVIGFIGWQFGLTECASAVLVIGFSCDYCVHIAHGYIVAPLKDSRKHRCQFALLQNGHAIMSSSVVSVLSTIPILASVDELLYWKMGILTTLTIAFSVIFSFSAFTLLLATVAPEGSFGQVYGKGSDWRKAGKSVRSAGRSIMQSFHPSMTSRTVSRTESDTGPGTHVHSNRD